MGDPASLQDGLLNLYANEMEKYSLENALPFKILLIIDNILTHSLFCWFFSLQHYFFYPTNRPRNNAFFKAYYLRKPFAHDIAATEEEDTDAILEGLKHLWLHQKPCWVWGDVTKEHINDIWKKTHKMFICDFKEFVKNKEATKIKKAGVEVADNFNQSVDKDDTGELLEVFLEELTNEKLLEWNNSTQVKKKQEKKLQKDKQNL